MSYLNAQREYLMSVKNKTRQQVDQLNQVDQALKGLTEGLQGQFNLGDINLPAPYQVRRALLGEGSYASTQSTTYANININGIDEARVRTILSDILGPAVIQAAAALPAR